MSFSRPVVFGNWKMNGIKAEALALVDGILAKRDAMSGTLGIFPP